MNRRLKMRVDEFRALLKTQPHIVHVKTNVLYSKYFKDYVNKYGRYYVQGMVDAIKKSPPERRTFFIREREYHRYRNGYNNGLHLLRHVLPTENQ